MKNSFKPGTFVISIIIPLAVGGLAAFITADAMQMYDMVNKPLLSPPAIVFPIVWTVLYILMGISSYLVINSSSPSKDEAITVYAIQLLVNFLWPIIFFVAEEYLIAFVWLLVLWLLVIYMTILFYQINKTAGLLQIPYIIWLTFAAYLNAGVYLLNR